jgi:hypothetical protein
VSQPHDQRLAVRMTPIEEPVPGSHDKRVVRVGDTVRRPRKPSSETVQELLGHLHDNGFDGCPRPLGFDEQDREVLSFVDGIGGSVPLPPEAITDQALVEHARLIRHFHDASASFLRSSDTWEPLLADPGGIPEIICHNDLSIPNTVYQHGLPYGLVDWDFASPGRRLWDLAYAIWWIVPLHRPEFMRSIGWSEVDEPRRLALFVDTYGLEEERSQLLDVLQERQRRNQVQLRHWAEKGTIPPFDADDPTVECGRTEYVEGIRTSLEAALDLR